MKLGTFRRSNFGLTTALYIFLAIAAADALRWFAPTDSLLNNGCIWLTSPTQRTDQLLLVYAEPKILETASPELMSLIQEIHNHSPKKIAIESTGLIHDFKDLNRLSCAGQLTVGFEFDELVSNPTATSKNRFNTAFIDLFHANQAVYQNGITSKSGSGTALRSFELEIAKAVSPLTETFPESSYGIRYVGGPNAIPNIKARGLLNGNLLRELIRDKIVLIGPDYPSQFHILTPTTTGDARMSRLEVRGNMVASLLNENYATNLGVEPSLVLLALITLGSIQAARQTPKQWLPMLAIANFVVLWGLFVICYGVTSFWLPATALILSGLLSTSIVALQRFSKLEDYIQFWKIQSTSREAHLQSRFEEDVWQAIGDAAYQMFQPTRVVMMELPVGATHLKRVKAIGCDYSQIFEKRLDYKRAPYWDPIQQKQAMRSHRRGFFVSTPGVQETEYILPLVHGMTTYGIIALAVESVALERWSDFDSFIGRFCHEMSQLIAGSIDQQESDRQRSNWFERWRTLPEERAFIDIQSDSQKQDDLVERVDVAFNCSESAMATFDIYGRVIRRNSNLNRLLQQTELSVSRASCVDVISTLSGLTMTQARKIFRDAILYDKSDNYLITGLASEDAPMMMYIKPMQLQEDDSRTSIETHGLLLEIVDGKAFQNVRQWNHELSSALLPEVIRKASELEQTAVLLQDSASKDPSMNELFGSVGETVSEIVSVLQDCQDLGSRQVNESADNYFLLNILPIWQLAKTGFSERLIQRSISISENFPVGDEIKAVANPVLLNRAFRTILQFLLDNAFDESAIEIEIRSVVEGVALRFTNQGGGTPVDALRKSLDQAANEGRRQRSNKFVNLDTAHVDQLQCIDQWLSHWNGAFSVKNLPHCVTITVTLSTSPSSPEQRAVTAASPQVLVNASGTNRTRISKTGTETNATNDALTLVSSPDSTLK